MLQSVVRLVWDTPPPCCGCCLCHTVGSAVSALKKSRVDVLPEFDAPIVEVQTEALGLSAAEVRIFVTINLEEILHRRAIFAVNSLESVPGLSSVLLTFEPGAELLRPPGMMQEHLTMA